jgi:hypothetical protein
MTFLPDEGLVLRISDVSVPNGIVKTKKESYLLLTVTLPQPSASPVTIAYATNMLRVAVTLPPATPLHH